MALALFLLVRTTLRPSDRGVIKDHIEFGRRVVLGLDLYATNPLDDKPLHPPYPPSFGLLTAPFHGLALLHERVARAGWGLLQLGSLFVIGLCLLRLVPDPRRTQVTLFVTALLAARFVLRDTHGGGGNAINLALALAAFACAERGRPLLGGALLGFSLATKPNLVLLVPLLLLFGHWRTALAGLAAAAACVATALLLLGQGLAPFSQWLTGTWLYATQQDLFAPPAQGFPAFTWMNQALRCLIERVCRTTPDALAAEVPGFVQGFGLAAGTTAAIRALAAASLLALTAGVAWRTRTAPAARPWLLAATFALTLLLSPISWKAHHVLLLPGLFLLVDARRWAFVLVFALCCLPGGDLLGDRLLALQESSYLVTLATLGTLGTTLGLALCAARAPR